MFHRSIFWLLLAVVFLPLPAVAQVDSRTQRDFLRLCKSEQATPEAIQEYLDQGVDPNAPNSLGSLALAMCAKRNDVESCRILIEGGSDVNCANARGAGLCNPLGIARTSGFDELEALLLEAGARPQPDNVLVDGRLIMYHMRGEHAATPEEMARWIEGLRAAGGDVDTRTSNGVDLLGLFVVFGTDLEVIRMLEEAGADFEMRDNDGNTLLHRCCMFGVRGPDYEFLEFFLDQGLDPNARALDGKTPLMVACFSNGMSPTPTGMAGAVQRLIDAGADIHAREKSGMGAIHYATGTSVRDNPEVAAMLLQAGADPNLVARADSPPLLGAAMGNWPSVVRLLVEAGADVNFVKKCCSDWTALHVAMMNSNDPVGVVEVLLAAGANPDALTTEGETPLDWAKRKLADEAASKRRSRPIRATGKSLEETYRELIDLLEPLTTQPKATDASS